MFHNWADTGGFFDTDDPEALKKSIVGSRPHARAARNMRLLNRDVQPLWSNSTADRWWWKVRYGFDTSDGGKYPDEKYDTVGIPIQFGKTDPEIYTALDAVDIDAEPIQFGGLLEDINGGTRRSDARVVEVPTNKPIFYLIDRLVYGTKKIGDMKNTDWSALLTAVKNKIQDASNEDILVENPLGQNAAKYGKAVLRANFDAKKFHKGKIRILEFVMPFLENKIETAEREESSKKRERDEEDAADARKRQKEDMDLKICRHVLDVSARFVSSLATTGPPTICFIADNAVYACSKFVQNVVYVTGTDAVVQKMEQDQGKGNFFVFLGAFGNYTIDSLKEDIGDAFRQYFDPATIEDLKRDTRRAYTVTNILRLYEWARARVAQREEILDTLERLSRIRRLHRLQVYVGSA